MITGKTKIEELKNPLHALLKLKRTLESDSAITPGRIQQLKEESACFSSTPKSRMAFSYDDGEGAASGSSAIEAKSDNLKKSGAVAKNSGEVIPQETTVTTSSIAASPQVVAVQHASAGVMKPRLLVDQAGGGNASKDGEETPSTRAEPSSCFKRIFCGARNQNKVRVSDTPVYDGEAAAETPPPRAKKTSCCKRLFVCCCPKGKESASVGMELLVDGGTTPRAGAR